MRVSGILGEPTSSLAKYSGLYLNACGVCTHTLTKIYSCMHTLKNVYPNCNLPKRELGYTSCAGIRHTGTMKRFVVHKVTVYRIYDNLKQQWHYAYGYVEEDSKEKTLKICAQLNELHQNLKHMQAKDYK